MLVGKNIIIIMVYFVLQSVRWISTIVSLQYKIVQNCPEKSIVSHNDLNSTVGTFAADVNNTA